MKHTVQLYQQKIGNTLKPEPAYLKAFFEETSDDQLQIIQQITTPWRLISNLLKHNSQSICGLLANNIDALEQLAKTVRDAFSTLSIEVKSHIFEVIIGIYDSISNAFQQNINLTLLTNQLINHLYDFNFPLILKFIEKKDFFTKFFLEPGLLIDMAALYKSFNKTNLISRSLDGDDLKNFPWIVLAMDLKNIELFITNYDTFLEEVLVHYGSIKQRFTLSEFLNIILMSIEKLRYNDLNATLQNPAYADFLLDLVQQQPEYFFQPLEFTDFIKSVEQNWPNDSKKQTFLTAICRIHIEHLSKQDSYDTLHAFYLKDNNEIRKKMFADYTTQLFANITKENYRRAWLIYSKFNNDLNIFSEFDAAATKIIESLITQGQFQEAIDFRKALPDTYAHIFPLKKLYQDYIAHLVEAKEIELAQKVNIQLGDSELIHDPKDIDKAYIDVLLATKKDVDLANVKNSVSQNQRIKYLSPDEIACYSCDIYYAKLMRALSMVKNKPDISKYLGHINTSFPTKAPYDAYLPYLKAEVYLVYDQYLEAFDHYKQTLASKCDASFKEKACIHMAELLLNGTVQFQQQINGSWKLAVTQNPSKTQEADIIGAIQAYEFVANFSQGNGLEFKRRVYCILSNKNYWDKSVNIPLDNSLFVTISDEIRFQFLAYYKKQNQEVHSQVMEACMNELPSLKRGLNELTTTVKEQSKQLENQAKHIDQLLATNTQLLNMMQQLLQRNNTSTDDKSAEASYSPSFFPG